MTGQRRAVTSQLHRWDRAVSLLLGIPALAFTAWIALKSSDGWIIGLVTLSGFAASAMIGRRLAGLRQVEFDEDTVHLSDGRQAASVPLRHIANRGYSVVWKNCWLEFQTDTPFGRRIRFFPKRTLAGFGAIHHDVNAFYRAVSEARLRERGER